MIGDSGRAASAGCRHTDVVVKSEQALKALLDTRTQLNYIRLRVQVLTTRHDRAKLRYQQANEQIACVSRGRPCSWRESPRPRPRPQPPTLHTHLTGVAVVVPSPAAIRAGNSSKPRPLIATQ